MPSCRFFAAGSVRTRQKHQSAWCAVEVQNLLAVDDIMAVFAPGGCLQRGEVRSRPRLGKALAPPIVDVGGTRQKPLLLCLGAELDQHRADHRDVERGNLGCGRQLVLLEEDHALDRRPAGTAIFLGPVEGSPAAPVEDALPADRIFLARRIAEPHPLADVVRQIVADKSPQLVAELQLVIGEAKVHNLLSSFGTPDPERSRRPHYRRSAGPRQQRMDLPEIAMPAGAGVKTEITRVGGGARDPEPNRKIEAIVPERRPGGQVGQRDRAQN